MAIAIAVTLVCLSVAVFVHYEALRLISSRFEHFQARPRNRILIVVFGGLAAHIVEIAVFAVAFWALPMLGPSSIEGDFSGDWVDYFYVSASSYTTLGMGDAYAVGPLRLLTAVESILGLVLIGWSTSFTYLAMRDFWKLH